MFNIIWICRHGVSSVTLVDHRFLRKPYMDNHFYCTRGYCSDNIAYVFEAKAFGTRKSYDDTPVEKIIAAFPRVRSSDTIGIGHYDNSRSRS